MEEIKQAFGTIKPNTTRIIISGKAKHQRLVIQIPNENFFDVFKSGAIAIPWVKHTHHAAKLPGKITLLSKMREDDEKKHR